MSVKLAQSGEDNFDLAALPGGSGRWLVNLRSDTSGHWVAWQDEGAWLAAARVARAEKSAFAELSTLPSARLDQSIALEAVWLSDRAEAADLLPGLLYSALRVGRIWGRHSVVAYLAGADVPIAKHMRLAPLQRAPRATVAGVELSPAAQRLEVSLHYTASECRPETWSTIQPTLVDEVLATLHMWFPRMLGGSWAKAILNGTLSREQYIYCLQNMHHYVRQTTRHLGRAVACSADRKLRSHYIEHLKGEINHELHIERDLRQLGVDPEYVIHHSVASLATKEFQAIQETTIGFYQDPVCLMACPMVAEGITAHIDQRFIDALRATVAGWGVDKPERAIGFLTSHAAYDGGEDGHFAMTAQILREYLVDEAMQRRFLATLAVAADCIERSFNSSVDEMRLFSTTL